MPGKGNIIHNLMISKIRADANSSTKADALVMYSGHSFLGEHHLWFMKRQKPQILEQFAVLNNFSRENVHSNLCKSFRYVESWPKKDTKVKRS